MEPILQVALDFVNLSRALKVAGAAHEAGATWLEAGTPLIKSEGLDAVRALHKEFPRARIIADMKTMDAGRIEVECAAKAGASLVMVLGVASESTIAECVEVARNYGCEIGVDTVGVADPAALAVRCQELGAHLISVHCPIDDQMRGASPFERLKTVAGAVTIPVAVAGGINSETAAEAVSSGANVVVVGGAITKAEDPGQATSRILEALRTGQSFETELFKRADETDIRRVLEQVSTPNVSDAMHRGGHLPGLVACQQGARACGRAVTVRTYPGDWAKPVEAIERCEEGDVLVIDAAGVGPAVWGELASESSLQRKISACVVYGAIRDVDSIRQIGFPCWSTLIMPAAGEPKGFGEINVPIKVAGMQVEPGDWISCDDNGVVRIPRARAVEIANRSMDVLEQENRLREEIRQASTLSEVMELLRWEKK